MLCLRLGSDQSFCCLSKKRNFFFFWYLYSSSMMVAQLQKVYNIQRGQVIITFVVKTMNYGTFRNDDGTRNILGLQSDHI